MGSSTDPTLNGHLKYPNNLDQSLNEAADQFHFRRAAFAQQLKSKVDLALAKTAALRINLNLDHG